MNYREQNIFRKILKSWAPPPVLSISKWADKYRYLSPEASAEPGKWNTSRAEFQRGIMDTVTDPEIETVVIMSSAQIGKTEIIANIVGYFISQDPAPILMVMPTLDMAQTWSKDRFSTMVRDTEMLSDKIRSPKTRDSDNTILHKVFPGGHITVSGANSAASLSSRPIRIILLDEIDKYPPSAGTEGDPVSLAIKRSATFWNRMIIMTSTPSIKGVSRIEAAWNESDQRRYFVPCPKCKKKQNLIWGCVVWENRDPATAMYECEYCKFKWSDAKRWAAIRLGEWQTTKEAKFKNIAGFHINEIYSPWKTLEEMVTDFYKSKENPERLKVFLNASLGKPWEAEGDKVDYEILFGRREKYSAQVPEGGLVLTAGVDVQDDRLEVEVKAWGKGEESWGVDYIILHGDPGHEILWNDLDSRLDAKYQHESGINLKISCTCVDTGGHFTNEAYSFCKGKEVRRIFAIKGANAIGNPIISRPSIRNRAKVKLFSIGTDTAKQTLYSRLKIDESGPGYMHFPIDKNHTEEYFKQLTAEIATTKYSRGFPHRVWIKTRPRNEVLDATIYSMAALAILNPNFDKIAESFGKIRNELDNVEKEKQTKSQRKNGWLKDVRHKW